MCKDESKGSDQERKRASAAAVKAAKALLLAMKRNVNVPGYGPTVLYAYRAALQEFCNIGDPIERAAYEMAMAGVIALVTKHADAQALVRRFDAWRRGSNDPDSNALAILDIAEAVNIAAFLRKHRDDSPGFYAKVGQDAAKNLRQSLMARFGERVPSVDDLEQWIDRHAASGGKTKLTTEGIVARIVHRGRLLGASGGDEGKTLQRVSKVLSRHGTRLNAGRGMSSD